MAVNRSKWFTESNAGSRKRGMINAYVYFFCRNILSSSSKKKRKSGILGNNDESEGEVDTLPPSPGIDDDAGSVSSGNRWSRGCEGDTNRMFVQKRRSARNTQRKKYVDDIMLAISDEDSRKSPSPVPRTTDNTKSSTPERCGSHFSDSAVKPNFVYVVSICTSRHDAGFVPDAKMRKSSTLEN